MIATSRLEKNLSYNQSWASMVVILPNQLKTIVLLAFVNQSIMIETNVKTKKSINVERKLLFVVKIRYKLNFEYFQQILRLTSMLMGWVK